MLKLCGDPEVGLYIAGLFDRAVCCIGAQAPLVAGPAWFGGAKFWRETDRCKAFGVVVAAVVNGFVGASEKLDELDDRVPLFFALRCRFALGRRPEGFVPLVGDSAFNLASVIAALTAFCDFFRWAAGLDRWLAPVGLPRRTEHF